MEIERHSHTQRQRDRDTATHGVREIETQPHMETEG